MSGTGLLPGALFGTAAEGGHGQERAETYLPSTIHLSLCAVLSCAMLRRAMLQCCACAAPSCPALCGSTRPPQMTAEQQEAWLDDPNQYVADEEDAVRAGRAGGGRGGASAGRGGEACSLQQLKHGRQARAAMGWKAV